MSNHSPSDQHPPMAPNAAKNSNIVTAAPGATKPIAVATPGTMNAGACTKGTSQCCVQPSPDHIRSRAYEISQARNGGPGCATTDWSQAEQELTNAATAKV